MVTRLFINGSAGKLQALLSDVGSKTISVICHPHPQYGGSMDNNVVNAIKKGFERSDISSLLFNFRGVGKSDGTNAEGQGETEDVKAAINYCQENKYDLIAVSGYSFGAWIALRYLQENNPTPVVVLVAPPVGIYDFSNLSLPRSAFSLIIAGGEDPFCPVDSLKKWCTESRRSVTLRILSRSDHFFWGKEKEIAQIVADFMRAR